MMTSSDVAWDSTGSSDVSVRADAESAGRDGPECGHTKAIDPGRAARQAARKERKAAAKTKKDDQEGGGGAKACGSCGAAVHLLIRCQTDSSKQWRMLCGKCWHAASGGVPDGDADHPHYRYGGLWKSRALRNGDVTVKTPRFAK